MKDKKTNDSVKMAARRSRSVSCRVACALLAAMAIVGNAAADRVLVYNTDGCDMLYYPNNLPITPEAFKGVRLDYVKGTKIDTLSYCPQSSGFGNFTCAKAGDQSLNDMGRKDSHNALRDFIPLGTDSLKMACEWSRENKREVFVSVRVNDTHDSHGTLEEPNPLFPKFKREHPEFLMGSKHKDGTGKNPYFCNWSAVDFAHVEVRDRMKGFVRQLVENYDVDGIEYDFNRHAQLFKTVAWGAEATDAERKTMTDLMRELRAMTDEVGARKGKRIHVAVRTPDSVGYCKAIGIDLAAWFDAKLTDAWIGGGYFKLNPWKTSVDFARMHGVKFYASIDESRAEGEAKDTKRPYLKGRNTFANYMARFAEAMASGCDGVYLFNLEYAPLHEVAKVDPRNTCGLDQIYFATDRGSGGYRPWKYLKDGGRFYTLPQIDPGEATCKLRKGELKFPIVMGKICDGKKPKVTAKMLADVPRGGEMRILCNGVAMNGEWKDGIWESSSVGGTQYRVGENEFTVQVNECGSDYLLRDFALYVQYDK